MASKLPYVDKTLIDYLERMNPDRHPTKFEGEFELGKTAGKVELLRHLRRLFEDQVKASLVGDFK